MTEKNMIKESQSNSSLFELLLKQAAFAWGKSDSKTLGDLVTFMAKKDVEKQIGEALANATIRGADILERIRPRAESWQATKLLDHLLLWQMVV